MNKLIDFHEITNIFPMMTDEEIDKLADDIHRNGQFEAILQSVI